MISSVFPLLHKMVEGGEKLKDTPHRHFGQVELCYDAFCTRVTTSETGAAVLGGIAFAGLIGIAMAALSD